MPLVKIVMTDEGVTREQKLQFLKGATDVYTAAKSNFISGAIINVDGCASAGHNLN